MRRKLPHSLIILFFILGHCHLHAQSAIMTTGGDASGAAGSASYSVGQIACTTAEGSNGTSTQGVQQPYEFFIVGVDDTPEMKLQITVFPNPATTKVILNIGNLDPDNWTFQLFDNKGKLLNKQTITGKLTTIPLETQPAGNYLLKILNEFAEIQTFKIVKN